MLYERTGGVQLRLRRWVQSRFRGRAAGLGIHSLRETAMNGAIRNRVTMHEVRQSAGLADIRTTEVDFVCGRKKPSSLPAASRSACPRTRSGGTADARSAAGDAVRPDGRRGTVGGSGGIR